MSITMEDFMADQRWWEQTKTMGDWMAECQRRIVEGLPHTHEWVTLEDGHRVRSDEFGMSAMHPEVVKKWAKVRLDQ